MSVSESVIRASVANNIKLLDSTLTVVDEEFYISFKSGKKAFIDILAKDDFGCLTIIEIKKSNKTARSTIQQMYKYASFLKEKYRLESSKLRCIVLSTVWDELSAPFGEFCKDGKYETIGYKISYRDNKPPVFKKIIPEFIHGDSQPLNDFFFFQYKDKESKDKEFKELIELSKKIQSLNSVVFSLDMSQRKDETRDLYNIVNYSYGIIWVIYTGNVKDIEKEIQENNILTEVKNPYLVATTNHQDESIYRNILINFFLDSAINKNCVYQRYATHTLTNLLSYCKNLSIIYCGPMFADSIYEKDDIVDMSCGYSGLHPYYFKIKTTPKRIIHFNKAIKQINKFLQVNKQWRKGVISILANLNKNDIVEIEIFNPMNIFGLFNDLCINNESTRIPELAVIVKTDKGKVIKYRGELNCRFSSYVEPYEAISRSYPDLQTFKLRSIMQMINQYDDNLSKQYGLFYEIVCQTDMNIYDTGKDSWVNLNTIPQCNIDCFIKKNVSLVRHVGQVFKELNIGESNAVVLG